jgi:hypothetical protein
MCFTVVHVRYKSQPFRQIIAVYCEKHNKSVKMMCGRNPEILTATASGTYSKTLDIVWLKHSNTSLIVTKVDLCAKPCKVTEYLMQCWPYK